jgi:nucleoside transporter
MKFKTGSLLAFMMFAEYFIWGAWYVTMGTYMGVVLHSDGEHIGRAYAALAAATIVSPFFVGRIADRFFPAQRIMGAMHLLGGILLFLATRVANTDVFIVLILLYSLLYMPTIALSNSVAFYQMKDPGRQFPWIRVFGTAGWIVAGIIIGSQQLEKTGVTFEIAAAASILLGLVSFFLPNTPPKGAESQTPGTEAFVLFNSKPYVIFFIAAILVCIPLSFYYGFANPFLNELGLKNAAAKMTLGQFSEGLFILAIPFLFNRIGVKNMLLMGMMAWLLRYICFAYGGLGANSWMLYAGIILHGVCYDFFFVTGYMYTEKKAGEKIKNSAQQLFTIATYGVGMLIGTWVSGIVVDKYAVNTTSHDWKDIWFVPAFIAAGVLIYFILFFREKKQITVNQ